MVATGSKPPYGVRFLPEKSKGVAAPILLGPRLSCSDACGVRVSSLSCGLRFTIWVTPGNRLTKLRTSWPLCFTTGFPGSPNGVSPQFSLLNSKPVHKLGDIVCRSPLSNGLTSCRITWDGIKRELVTQGSVDELS